MLAGLAGEHIDKMIHKHGAERIDRDMARRQARQATEQMYDDYYISGSQASQYDPNMHGPPPRLVDRNVW